MYKINTNEHVCVCSELRNQIPKMQYLIILHFKTAQITVNFFYGLHD